MKICFMCDLHLPCEKGALQYDVLDWAIEDIRKKGADCIVYAGDVTCDGNETVYKDFLNKLNSLEIPFLYVPGNSDLRCSDSKETVRKLSSPTKNVVNGQLIFAVNDCDGNVDDDTLSLLEQADKNSIVFMHHPISSLSGASREKMLSWRNYHKDTKLFYGHLHKSLEDDNSISLQAMDPDKAIGENCCIYYYDTATSKGRKAYYFSPVPTDLYSYFGVSCYDIERDIKLAVKNGLKCIELRPSCASFDKAELCALVEKWRKSGGENLSVHLPEVHYENGIAFVDEKYARCVEIAKILKAERLVQHVPIVSVKTVNEDKDCLDKICNLLADYINGIEHEVVVGVENMHMTSKDTPDENRRFGYIPQECLLFMKTLSEKCRHKVGINFDIGHARNNAPYSQTYQISTWLATVGKYIVGYHIHQVTYENGIFENHMPITDVYGKLISFGSFFKNWAMERINKVPVIFEMRPENAYETTLKTFDRDKKRKVFDIHSHTYYSNCGRDNPKDLIETAIHNGISVLGICDHNYGIGDRKEQYLQEIRGFAKTYADRIRVLCGIEIATLPHLFDITDKTQIRNFDYCLIEHITDPQSIVGNDLIGFCKNLGIPCGIAHTDLFAYCDLYGFDYYEFFKSLADNGIFWEMNVTYDSIHGYREHQYVLDFMKDADKQNTVKKAGTVISIGCDSHRCEDYDGFKVHTMYDFLTENGFNTADKMLLK